MRPVSSIANHISVLHSTLEASWSKICKNPALLAYSGRSVVLELFICTSCGFQRNASAAHRDKGGVGARLQLASTLQTMQRNATVRIVRSGGDHLEHAHQLQRQRGRHPRRMALVHTRHQALQLQQHTAAPPQRRRIRAAPGPHPVLQPACVSRRHHCAMQLTGQAWYCEYIGYPKMDISHFCWRFRYSFVSRCFIEVGDTFT